MASEIRVNQIQNRSGLGTVTFSDTGVIISGILTATTFSGNLTGNVTGTVSSSGIATFSNGIIVAAGTTAAPSISPSGDSNTGIFFPSPDTVAIGEGGVEALRIDSSGHIGIANSSPKSWGSNIPTIEIKGTATSGGNSTRSGAIAFESGSGNNGYAVLWGQSGGIEIYTGATDRASATYRAKFDSTGNLAFASGNGIDFSATANSSGTMTSELLSDYEEGTWTPTIASTSSNVTYTSQSGQYTKIGRLVDFAFQININTVTSVGSGDFTIGGLPFTQGTNNGRYVIQTSDLDFDSTKYSHYAYPDGSTGLKVLYTADNSGWAVASATSFPVKAGSIITARGSYIV